MAAVERAVARLNDGPSAHDGAQRADERRGERDAPTGTTQRLESVETTVTELRETVAELEAATQALRGYVGSVRAVNRTVERRAEAALAAVARLDGDTSLDGDGSLDGTGSLDGDGSLDGTGSLDGDRGLTGVSSRGTDGQPPDEVAASNEQASGGESERGDQPQPWWADDGEPAVPGVVDVLRERSDRASHDQRRDTQSHSGQSRDEDHTP